MIATRVGAEAPHCNDLTSARVKWMTSGGDRWFVSRRGRNGCKKSGENRPRDCNRLRGSFVHRERSSRWSTATTISTELIRPWAPCQKEAVRHPYRNRRTPSSARASWPDGVLWHVWAMLGDAGARRVPSTLTHRRCSLLRSEPCALA